MSPQILAPFLAALLLAPLTTATSAAPDTDTWPRFRGHDGAGIGAPVDLPVPWSDTAIRWRFALPGGGHSSPVIWKDRVFVTCSDPATPGRILFCLGAADGRVLWHRAFPCPEHHLHRDNSYASSTPALDERALYLQMTTPEQVAVAALTHDGAPLWQTGIGPYKSQHGGGASPVRIGDLLALNNDQDGASSLVALDSATGAPRWKIERRINRVSYATPCVLRREGDAPQLIFASTSHGLTGVDPNSGEVRWEMPDLFHLRVVGSPAVAGGLALATCGEGGVGKRLVAVQPATDTEPARVAYERKKALPYVPTAIARGDLLFLWCDNGDVICLRTPSMEQLWQQRLPANFYASPVCAGDRLLSVSKDGTLFAIAASESYALIASVPLGERTFATPALAGGALYVRTEKTLFAIGKR